MSLSLDDLAKLTELEKAATIPLFAGVRGCDEWAAYVDALTASAPELLAIAAAHLKLCSAIEFINRDDRIFSSEEEPMTPKSLIAWATNCGWTWPDSAGKEGGNG